MRFVTSADQRPHKCVFYPQLGGAHDEGFIESDGLFGGSPLPDTAYVSIVALRDIAAKFPQVGLAPRSELTLAQAEIEALKAENEDLKEQMAAYDKELDAVSFLKGRGYQPVHRVGRPKAKA